MIRNGLCSRRITWRIYSVAVRLWCHSACARLRDRLVYSDHQTDLYDKLHGTRDGLVRGVAGGLYVITDKWIFRRGALLLLVFGQYALIAYFVSHIFLPVLKSFARCIGGGIIARFPSGEDFIMTMLCTAGLIIVLVLWRRIRSVAK